MKFDAFVEALNSPQRVNWRSYGTSAYGYFTIEDYRYRIHFKESLLIGADGEDIKIVNVSFQWNDATDRWSHTISGVGNELKVFSTVITEVNSYVSKNNPDFIIFSVVDEAIDYDKRAQLYDRLLKRYAKQTNYSVIRSTSDHAQMYVLTKKEIVTRYGITAIRAMAKNYTLKNVWGKK